MSVTLNDVENIAKLARLEFNQQEKEKLTKEMNTILRYIEKLNNLDTSAVEPLSHVINLTSAMRNDEVQPSLSQEEALSNAPARTEKFFKVPKVIG